MTDISAKILVHSGLFPEMALASWEDYLHLLQAGVKPTVESFDQVAVQAAEQVSTFAINEYHTDAAICRDSVTLLRSGLATYSPGEHFFVYDGDAAPEMLVIPPGKFIMGAHPLDPDAQPHERPPVHIDIAHALAVCTTPITFAQWDACVADGGTKYIPSDANWGRLVRPVINVSWLDAEEYIAWLNRQTNRQYRLLSEAEWEYACWAGAKQSTRYPWSDDYGYRQLEHHAWFYQNSEYRTQPVGNRQANAWGLSDMLGNVAEWVQDHYQYNFSVHPQDGSAFETAIRGSSRVVKGGSWLDNPRNVRPSSRTRFSPNHRAYNIGFRIALTVALKDGVEK